MYSTCKQQYTAKYTNYSTYRSKKKTKKGKRKERDRERTFTYCAHRDKGITTEEGFTEQREDLFEPSKKHFTLG